MNDHIGVSQMDNIAKFISKYTDKPFYFHSMRHMYTTHLLEKNLPENVVQSIQGWSSSDMLRIYDDRSQDSQLEKYFGEDGIIQVDQKSLSDL